MALQTAPECVWRDGRAELFSGMNPFPDNIVSARLGSPRAALVDRHTIARYNDKKGERSLRAVCLGRNDLMKFQGKFHAGRSAH